METGINLFCYGGAKEVCIEEQIDLMQLNGFGHTFIMADNPQLTDSLVDKVKRAGIVFDTLHAPFAGINNMWKKGEEGDEVLRRLTDCVDKCAAYDIPVAVVHLSSGRPAPLLTDAGYKRFSMLLEAAAKKNITLAFENQRFLSPLAYIEEQFEDAAFCWDVGHEGCFTKGIKFMELYGERLAAVHIHDNHHLADEDEHLIPFDGITNYSTVAMNLAKYGFCGTLMLEVFRSESTLYQNVSSEEYYSHAGKMAKRLIEMVEEEKRRVV